MFAPRSQAAAAAAKTRSECTRGTPSDRLEIPVAAARMAAAAHRTRGENRAVAARRIREEDRAVAEDRDAVVPRSCGGG